MTRTRAVVFDLWDTLVEWSREHSDAHRAEMIRSLGVDAERFTEVYTRLGSGRETGPLAEFLGRVCAELGKDGAAVEELLELRRGYARRELVPREGSTAPATSPIAVNAQPSRPASPDGQSRSNCFRARTYESSSDWVR